MASISFFFHESRLQGMFFITINKIKIQITKYITKYITNHNMNRDLEMKIRTFTEIVSYITSPGDDPCFGKWTIVSVTKDELPAFTSQLVIFFKRYIHTRSQSSFMRCDCDTVSTFDKLERNPIRHLHCVLLIFQ